MFASSQFFGLAAVVLESCAGQTIYDREQVGTFLGCECTTPCVPSDDIECASHSVCSVKSRWCNYGAANFSAALGYYDFCAFGQHRPYESLLASEKHSMLWQRIKANTDSADFTSAPGPLDVHGVTWGSLSDIFPVTGRRKGNVGIVAPIRFESNGLHNYTGLFKGADFGLIRLVTFANPAMGSFRQGAAVKFLRSRLPSANFLTYKSELGLETKCQNHTEYFKEDLINHVGNDDNDNINFAKFFQATSCPKMMGLSDIATEQDGTAAPVFPFQLVLRGAQRDVHVVCGVKDAKGWFSNIIDIQAGSKIFEVFARAGPGEAAEPIGHMELTDHFTTSVFGDRQLFFKHQTMEEDFRLRPDWLEAIDKRKACGLPDRPSRALAPSPYDGCQFPMRADDPADLYI